MRLFLSRPSVEKTEERVFIFSNEKQGILTAVSRNGAGLLRRFSSFSAVQASRLSGNFTINPNRVIPFFQLTGLLLFVCHFPAVFSAVPYEICSDKNQAWTDRFIAKIPVPSDEKTEAGYCKGKNCRMEDQKFNAIKEVYDETSRSGKKEDIPSLCFYGSMLRNKKQPRVYNCKKSTSPVPDRGGNRARPCFNEDYVTATAKAFNEVTDCFDFSKKEKERFFALLNHESSFLLNARSSERARCFGQLTKNNILDTNSAIYFRDRMSVKAQSYGRIYKSAVQKCPMLKGKVIPPEIALVKAGSISNRRAEETSLTRMNQGASVTCGVTHDLFSCLFYSAYSMKMSELDFNESYDEIPDYMGNRRDPSSREKEDFLFPIHLNEMLVVQGEITRKATGERKTESFVFWDSSELHDFAKNIEYKRGNLKIKKVPLFDKKVLEPSFLYYAHNGGRSIVRKHLTRFLEDLKKRIANGRRCKKDRICSKYRASLMAGRPLGFSDLQTEFEEYAETAKLTDIGKPGRKDELVNFVKRIDENMRFLHNSNQKFPDEIKRKIMAFSGSDAATADQFINEVKKKCPVSPF